MKTDFEESVDQNGIAPFTRQRKPENGIDFLEFKKLFIAPYIRERLKIDVDQCSVTTHDNGKIHYLSRGDKIDFSKDIYVKYTEIEKKQVVEGYDDLDPYIQDYTIESILELDPDEFCQVFPPHLKILARKYYKHIQDN